MHCLPGLYIWSWSNEPLSAERNQEPGWVVIGCFDVFAHICLQAGLSLDVPPGMSHSLSSCWLQTCLMFWTLHPQFLPLTCITSQVFFSFGFWINKAVFRVYSWLCTQESYLMVLRRPHQLLRIQGNALHTVLLL